MYSSLAKLLLFDRAFNLTHSPIAGKLECRREMDLLRGR